MSEYFIEIVNGVKTFLTGMKMTLQHYNNKEELVATLQYPHEKWPIPERNIGFENSEYNLIQEQVAYGHGPHLDALTMITGCKPKVRFEFSQTLRSNYANLFSERKNVHELRNGIEKLIKSNNVLKASCIRT